MEQQADAAVGQSHELEASEPPSVCRGLERVKNFINVPTSPPQHPHPPYLLAVQATAAAQVKGHDHAVALFDLGHLGADLLHNAHGLVAQDVALFHAGHGTVVQVQVGSTQTAGCDLDDDVRRVCDRGNGHLCHPHVLPAG